MSKAIMSFEVSGKIKIEAMKYQSQNVRPCSCSNHLILAPGEVCELCLGIVEDVQLEENAHEAAPERFDYAYFEALERWYESMEFAA